MLVHLRFGPLFREPEICACLRLRAFVTVCLRSFAFAKTPFITDVYLNSVQQMVSGEFGRRCLQKGFERHGLPCQRGPLDTV